MYMAFSAAVGPPFGNIVGVIVAAGAAAGFAAFFAKAAGVKTARIAKPTRIFFITLRSSQVKRCDTASSYLREPRFPSRSSPTPSGEVRAQTRQLPDRKVQEPCD